jgi:hypothetical protein
MLVTDILVILLVERVCRSSSAVFIAREHAERSTSASAGERSVMSAHLRIKNMVNLLWAATAPRIKK